MRSLRGRGLAAIVVVSVYIAAGAWTLNAEREHLHALSLELEQLHEKDSVLGKTQIALHHSLIRAKELTVEGAMLGQHADDVALDLELVHSGLVELERFAPEVAGDSRRTGALIRQLRSRQQTVPIASVEALEGDLERRIISIDNALHGARGDVWQRYHDSYDRMTLIGLMVNLVGVIFFGALVTKFFSRLTWDLRKLEERAASIVAGYRGPPLEVARRDEVGELMDTVNTMQMELRERERRLEIARQREYHREKAAALGSLASAVAHEINNPIAAIVGIARAMTKTGRSGRALEAKAVAEGPEMILEQAQRIATISRQISEFARPPDDKPAMIDVNAVIRSTCRFLQFDRRLRNIGLHFDLDKELRAAYGVADHVIQVLVNLLVNAADAVGGMDGRQPMIEVATRSEGNEVLMSVRDNGPGMDAATLARVFEEAFSTKPEGSGRGLGLFICRALLERHGGRIELRSTVGTGTVADVRLPVHPVVQKDPKPC